MESTDDNSNQDSEDIFDLYFSLVENSSESPFIYHRWSLITAVGAMLGRQAYINFSIDTIYPNMYTCLMGGAGSRKSSAIKFTRKLLESTGYKTFAREKTSSQKFIKDLGEGFDCSKQSRPKSKMTIDDHKAEFEELNIDYDNDSIDDGDDDSTSEVFVTAGELEDFLGQNDGAFISLLTNLWDNLDSYSHGKMTSDDVYVNKPTISLIGGTTPTTFNAVFPPEVIGQGMLSRLLLVYGGGARTKITLPPPPPQELMEFFVKHLSLVREHMVGEFTVSPEAFEVWDAVYKTDIDLGDHRLESYCNRRHVHFYKLCLILAALDLTKVITKDIAIKANSILSYTEQLMPKALGEFGRSRNSDVSQQVVEILDKTGEDGITHLDLYKKVAKEVEDLHDFTKILNKLVSSGRVKQVKGTAKFCSVSEQSKTQLPHTDYTLLREFRELTIDEKVALCP